MSNNSACFWHQFERVNYLFCEEQLCGIIAQPANTWSNIGFLIVAILIFRRPDSRPKRYFLISSIVLFVGSTLFHASGTYFGKFLDVSGMFFVSGTVLNLSLQRKFNLSDRKSDALYILILSISITFLAVMRFGNILFASQLLASVYLEWSMAKTENHLHVEKLKLAALVLMGAFGIWLLDVFKILCYPGNHILTGHGVWHLMCALSIYLMFTAYRSSTLPPSSPPLP